MNRILAGNIVFFLGAILMVLVGFLKDKTKTLIVQNFQFLIMGIGNLILGGVSGFIGDMVSLVRNVVCIKFEFGTVLKIVFIVVQGIITFVFNQEGWRAILPFLGIAVFTVCLDTKNIKVFKVSILLSQLLWLAYDICNINISGVVFDVLAFITNSIALYQIIKGEKKRA